MATAIARQSTTLSSLPSCRGRLCRAWATSVASTPRGGAAPVTESTATGVESRWRRLKRERRLAPRPKSRPVNDLPRDAQFDVDEALHHVRRLSWARFEESVDIAISLGIDPRRADHNLKGCFYLPQGHGPGVRTRVAVFVDNAAGPDGEAAREGGAAIVGDDAFLEDVVEKKAKPLRSFASCLATSEMTGRIASKAGRLLGPKGLLPSVKMRTVIPAADDVQEFVHSFVSRAVLFKVDRAGNVRLRVGKLSLDDNCLQENLLAVMRGLNDMKPANVKRGFVKSAVVSSTMGPGVPLRVDRLLRHLVQRDTDDAYPDNVQDGVNFSGTGGSATS